MKYIGAGMVWLGYAGAVAAMAFGTGDANASAATAIIGAIIATIASIGIASSK